LRHTFIGRLEFMKEKEKEEEREREREEEERRDWT
jgi:hypothetical protein